MSRSVALLCYGDQPVHARVNRLSGLNPDRSVAEQVIEVLESTEFRMVVCLNWRRFHRCAAASHAAVIVAFRLDPSATTAGLRETAHHEFPCPLILVTDGDRENLRHLAVVRVTHVVFLEEVTRRLTQVLASIALSDGRLLLREAIRRREMHPTLRRALLTLVDLPLPEPARYLDFGIGRRFPRTVKELADLVHKSADYFYQLADEARLPLGGIVRRNAAIRALEMHAAGVRREAVAECFGYEEPSGVRNLIARNLHGRPGDLLISGLHRQYANLARFVETKSGPENDPTTQILTFPPEPRNC